ncbi:hypothetical protein BJX66DRAFT_331043 [Aspergillus keveii]|uniref:TauD/TfdA-like domain-containing protein n=1 Tax=Aspergillus keveii TaxID=714993 RepID=A0ABR4FHL9_9EURO
MSQTPSPAPGQRPFNCGKQGKQSSNMTIQPGSQIRITPQEHDPTSKVNVRNQFGAIITGCDLNNLDEADFQAIQNAIYVHSVVIIKGQHDLLPINQYDLIKRLNPEARAEHGWGTSKEAQENTGITRLKWYTIPGTPAVQMFGHGYPGDDHYGLKGITMQGTSHDNYHAEALPKENIARGRLVTTLRSVRVPKGPPLTVRWDDGSGRTMKAQAGATAFYSNAQLYDLLTPEEKLLADNSYGETAPYPFVWTGNGKLDVNELPPWSVDKVYKYPMVWVNPVTGKKGFQVRAEAVRKLYLRSAPGAKYCVIEDPEQIRIWLNGILDRIIVPGYINIPLVEEGDVGGIHSATEYPEAYGVRTVHQCHIASSTPPLGPHDSTSTNG